jgi:hypothetical protein
MFITYLINNLRSKTSESELLKTLNITIFDITIYAIVGDLLNTKYIGDFIKIKGKTYILINRTANLRLKYISF